MGNKVVYQTQTYHVFKATLYALPVFILLVFSVIKLAIYLHNTTVAVVGWVIVCSAPFLFQKKFKSMFTTKVEVQFDSSTFSTKNYTRDEVLEKETTINWDEMKFYKFYFSDSNITNLTVHLRDGSTKRFSFKDEKDQEQAMKERSVFSLFDSFVKQYNSGKQSENQIGYKQGFSMTFPENARS